MADGMKQRKRAADTPIEQRQIEVDKKKEQPLNLEPDMGVAIIIVMIFAAFIGLIIYYKVDQSNNGAFAAFVNSWLLPKNRYQKVDL